MKPDPLERMESWRYLLSLSALVILLALLVLAGLELDALAANAMNGPQTIVKEEK